MARTMTYYEQQMLAEMKTMNTNIALLVYNAGMQPQTTNGSQVVIPTGSQVVIPTGSWGNGKAYELVKPFSFGGQSHPTPGFGVPSPMGPPTPGRWGVQPSTSGFNSKPVHNPVGGNFTNQQPTNTEGFKPANSFSTAVPNLKTHPGE
jgi:hypothetical protein